MDMMNGMNVVIDDGSVSPEAAAQMLGAQPREYQDTTDLSIFGPDDKSPIMQTNPNVAIDGQFSQFVTKPNTPAPQVAPQPQAPKFYQPHTSMNKPPVQNAPASRESFSDMLNRFKGAATQTATPATSTPPNPTPGTPPAQPKIEAAPNDEPSWMNFFNKEEPQATPAADSVTPAADANAPGDYSKMPVNERVSKFFNQQEQSIINNAMDASAMAIENAQNVYRLAVERGFDGQQVIERIGSLQPAEILDMLSLYDAQRASQVKPTAPLTPQGNPNPASPPLPFGSPAPTPPNPLFSSKFVPTRPIPGVNLGTIPSTVKEPPPSILGVPQQKWQI